MSKSRREDWHPRFDLHMGRDGSGIGGVGYIRLVDGVLFIDEVPLTRMLEQFIDRYVELGIFAPAAVPDVYTERDEKIKPLVDALNRHGIRTFSSCEGHFDTRYETVVTRPYVWVHRKDWEKSGLQPRAHWGLSRTVFEMEAPAPHEPMMSLQYEKMAETEEELALLQQDALDYAAELG